MRILIIEDSPTSAEAMKSIVENRHHRAILAKDWVDAVPWFRRCDGVLQDWLIPGIEEDTRNHAVQTILHFKLPLAVVSGVPREEIDTPDNIKAFGKSFEEIASAVEFLELEFEKKRLAVLES